nr:YsnF/AvaK domain-containing protein [uncultured Duganella sp.]
MATDTTPPRPPAPATGHADADALTVPVHQERLHVGTRLVDTGAGVRVHKRVRSLPRQVERTLWHDELEVRRVPVDRLVDAPPAARREGDTFIIPVLEEELVVHKRYRLKEELHITRQRRASAHRQTVPLRAEHVTVERFSDGGDGGGHSPTTPMQGTAATMQGEQAAGAGSMQRAATERQAIPVVREELKVGKRTVQRGGVHVYQRVVETPVREDVTLREEHVTVERRPLDQAIDPDQVPAFQDKTFELRANAEEAVVQKSARVVEEVVVGKEVSQREQQVSDTVRGTEVEVEQLAPDIDSHFRTHWQGNYAASGGRYEDYDPAYRYGS